MIPSNSVLFYLQFLVIHSLDTFPSFFSFPDERRVPLTNNVISRRRLCAFVPACRGVKVNKVVCDVHACLACTRVHTLRFVCSPRVRAPGGRSIAVNSSSLRRAGTSIVRSIRSYFVRWISNRGEELSEYRWGLSCRPADRAFPRWASSGWFIDKLIINKLILKQTIVSIWCVTKILNITTRFFYSNI